MPVRSATDNQPPRGRRVFQRFEPVFEALESLVGRFPQRARQLGLDLMRFVPGRVGLALRYVLIRSLSRSCGRVVGVFEGVYLHHPENMQVGDFVSIHPMCYLDASGGLSIGSNVSIAHAVTIMTTEHDYRTEDGTIRDAPVIFGSVSVGNDVWIGAGAKVLAGVTIGDHVVIGAGAVVTKDIPTGSVAVGVPARVIKQTRVVNEA